MYGYKAVLDTGRDGTYEKGFMLETPRIQCRQITRTGNWKGLSQTRWGRTLLHAKGSHESGRGLTVFGV